jgi:excisionase family DNA binding protein
MDKPHRPARRLLTVTEVAEHLGLRPHAVYAMIRQGILPAVAMGRRLRVDSWALDEWIDRGGQALPGRWRWSPE